MDSFCVLRNHGVKFGEYRKTFDPSPHMNFFLEIHVKAIYKALKQQYRDEIR